MKHTIQILFLTITMFGCIGQDNSIDKNSSTESKKEKFIWDFDSDKVYVYSFRQESSSVNDWGEPVEDLDTSYIIGSGAIKVKSKGNKKADFILNIKVEKDDMPPLGKDLPARTMVIPDMNADGQFESKSAKTDFLFDIIFALPSKDLKKGESEILDMEVPFNVMGSPLQVKGYNQLTYVKDVGRNTALIRSEFKVDQLDVPEEIEGEFSCSLIGNATFEFNYEKKHFKSSKVELDMKMASNFGTEKEDFNQMNMKMESTSNYTIQLTDIEER